jgi:hypothetical protein
MDEELYLIELIDKEIEDAKKWAVKGFFWPKRDYTTFNLALLMYWYEWREFLTEGK